MYQARKNAKKALEKSVKSPIKASFVVNEYDKLVGPLISISSKRKELLEKRKGNEILKKPMVADYKIKEVLLEIRESKEKQITSEKLAQQLEITKRSANRILSAMEENNIIEIVGTKQTSKKGRPERIYSEVKKSN